MKQNNTESFKDLTYRASSQNVSLTTPPKVMAVSVTLIFFTHYYIYGCQQNHIKGNRPLTGPELAALINTHVIFKSVEAASARF